MGDVWAELFLPVVVALSLVGTISIWQGGRILIQTRALRRRGVWVPGVIERRIVNGMPFAVYQYVDLDGQVRFANMAAGRIPKAQVTPTEIRIDPAGRIPPRHLREAESWQAAGAVGMVLFGVLWWVLFGLWLYHVTHQPPSADGTSVDALRQATRSAYPGFFRM